MGRLLGAWVIPLGVLVIAGSAGYREANFYVQLLLVGSVPLIVLASLICFVFARSVAEHPVSWALAAIFTTVTIAAAEAGFAGAILSMVLSVPAAGLFVLLAKIWPVRMPATNHNKPKC
jgi:hypothetical protein